LSAGQACHGDDLGAVETAQAGGVHRAGDGAQQRIGVEDDLAVGRKSL
jgi:hypothetical protein